MLAASFLLALVGCYDFTGPSIPHFTVTVTSPVGSILVGEMVPLIATVYRNGIVDTGDRSIGWSISGPGVATMMRSQTGEWVVRGLRAGYATITARVSVPREVGKGGSDSVELTVTDDTR